MAIFQQDGSAVRYDGTLFFSRVSVSKVLRISHDLKLSGHFGYTKSMERLQEFYWKHMGRDVRKYIRGCIICQQYKDSRKKALGERNPLEVPARR